MTPAEVLPPRIAAKVRVDPSGCWLWTASRCSGGYGTIFWSGRARAAHRVVYEIARGTIPDGDGYHGTCVLHRCDVPACVNPKHLFLGSHTANMRDMSSKRRAPNRRGRANGNARLTDAQVREIRAARGRERQQDVADRFGVARQLVSQIQLRQIWAHVE